jgi:hypothetical protein
MKRKTKKEKQELHYKVLEILDNHELDEKFITYRSPGGVFLAKLHDNGVITDVSINELKKFLYKFLKTHYREFSLTHKDCDEIAEWYVDLYDTFEEPLVFKFKGNAAYARHIIPFELNMSSISDEELKNKAPHWNMILNACSRVENYTYFKGCKEDFCYFLATLFDLNAKRDKYLWLCGDNKITNAILNALEWAFGSTFFNSYPPKHYGIFWRNELIGKRVVVFKDCDDYQQEDYQGTMIASHNNVITIFQRRKPQFQSRMHCKFIFTSKEMPKDLIKKEERFIPCRILKFKIDNNFGNHLIDEAPIFFNYCYNFYQSIINNSNA